MGEVISDLVRRALAGGVEEASDYYVRAVAALPSLPRRDAPVVTLDTVNNLRDQELS